MDIDPVFFSSGFQDVKKNFLVFLLISYCRFFTSVFKGNKSLKSRKTVEIKGFFLHAELELEPYPDPDPNPEGPKTDGSGRRALVSAQFCLGLRGPMELEKKKNVRRLTYFNIFVESIFFLAIHPRCILHRLTEERSSIWF
jgi:hypothetical protein